MSQTERLFRLFGMPGAHVLTDKSPKSVWQWNDKFKSVIQERTGGG